MRILRSANRIILQLTKLVLVIQVLFFCSSCRDVVPPMPPAVIGVEDGIIYGTGIKIDIDNREENVKYSAEINNTSFSFGETFDIQGIHTLRTIATKEKSGLTSERVITFEIDKIPPPKPDITGVEQARVYNNNVVIYTLEEEGIKYKASINGQTYNFGDAFSEEGDHHLRVDGIKQRNGLVSSKEIDFSIDYDKYTQDEIDYLTEITFGGEFGGDPERIKKWVDNIGVKVHGAPTQMDIEALSLVIEELNVLINGINISFTDDLPNIEVYYIPHHQFSQQVPENIAKDNVGLFIYYSGDFGNIEYAKVLIASDKPTEEERAHLIREEFTQALGLAQDSWKYSESIFYQGWTLVQSYSDIDKRIISMLYHEDIKPNMGKKSVRTYFHNKKSDNNIRAQVFPVDRADENPSFLHFKNELLNSIETRDLDFILGHIDEDFSYHPVGPRGFQAFKEYFGLDHNSEDSALWEVLRDGLTLGGVFLHYQKPTFEAPYIRSRFPIGYNPYTYKVAIGRDISIHEKPNIESRTIGLLQYDIVKWLPPSPGDVSPDDIITGESYSWDFIETLGGMRGYVKTTYLRRPMANTITIELKHGRWMITSITN